ncbi:MAG: RNA polymerase sigma factor, partial [Myxococcota bacterium]
MPQDVADLVTAAKGGDRAAFDALVRLTYAETYTLAYRLTGNEDDARDVVQDAYLRAYRGLRRFRGEAQFSTWMYRITANCAATYLGRRARHRHDDLDESAPVVDPRTDHDPQLRADADDLRARLRVALDGLPP